ncbi:MAG TPA: LPS export ABC transporter ATP-binding protein [Spirochaetaceae bacterium]|nr:LPS export ABC transporter ATP-binding protein [Spirochaetaceae bacterium]
MDDDDKNTNILRVENLVKFYGRRQVVKGLSFEMRGGDIVGLLGPNGAGKTTTFYMIVGFIKANGGNITINGEAITTLPMFKRSKRGLAYLPQEPSIFRKLTVEQNIMLILEVRKDLTRADRQDELERLLGEFGLTKLRRQFGLTLSGGERRRTEIARCLASKPKFLLLDEPFAGIDPIAVSEIKDMIRYLSSLGIGVLITDHNVRDALAVTKYAHIINNGSILVSGTKDELLSNEVAVRTYFGKDYEEYKQ